MPNILLTTDCARQCPYCFAGEYMARTAPGEMMSWENFIYIVDFFERGGDRMISLLGGEPLLHPEAADFIVYLNARGMHARVFTSGIVGETALTRLVDLLAEKTPDELSIVVNYNNPAMTPPSHQAMIERFLSSPLAKFISLGVNVFELPFDFSYAVDAINRYGLDRTLRVGICNPVPGGKNRHISPDRMKEMATCLIDALPMMEAFGVVATLDCGVPLCAFTDEQLGRLFRHCAAVTAPSFVCDTSIDVGPDMMVWNCFPTARHASRSLFEFDSFAALHQWLKDFHANVRIEHGGMYPECDACRHRRSGLCAGGCLAHPLSQFLTEPPTLRNENIRPLH